MSAAALAPQCAATTLPDAFSDWHKVLVPFFDDREQALQL